MTDFARIPQPREGEPLSGFCLWCGAGRAEYGEGKYHRVFACSVTLYMSEATPSVRAGLWGDPRRGLCNRAPANLATVCADVVAEREGYRRVDDYTSPEGNTSTYEICSSLAPKVGRWESDTERLRRVLIDSHADQPATEAGREVAGLLADIRNKETA